MFDNLSTVRRFGWIACATAVLSLLVLPSLMAQTTISTGSIQGTVTDPSGAVLSGAKISITNKATNQVITTSSNSAGTYASGALIPGQYLLRVEAKGFKATELPVTVEVGVTINGNVKLQVGQSTEVIEVQGSAVNVNTEQAVVQGVLTTDQIENLPVNGRNFLDLAQLEPGVQIQEGSTFDPTKNGFSSISFGGRYGRTARVEVDGVDVSDETVGTTTQNIPASAIQEFQLSSSSLDLSTELTSSGSVNVVTRSGSNTLHGEALGYYRNSKVGNAALPGGSAVGWEREQFGGNLGGYIIKDKLFFFVDGERNRQDLPNPVLLNGPFASLSGPIGEPFREIETSDRLDYKISQNARAFYRFSYDQLSDIRPFGAGPSLQPFLNRNNTPSHAVGVDFNTGSFTHAVRFEYLKFRNQIVDGSKEVPRALNPIPDVTINIGNAINQCASGSLICTGPNLLAPQQTYQTDHQIKYDGSRVISSHVLRYGVGFNRIRGGGFASFFGLAPSLNTFGTTPISGSANDVRNYPADTVILSNDQGFFTEVPAFGFKAGGQHDNRLQFYFGDAWKIRPNFTLSYGLRWVRDEGRTDSDLPPIPAVNQWGAGLGNRVDLPNHNFGPQLGFVWDPASNGKTAIRGGAGIFYENAIFNNVLFDRPGRLPTGLFLNTPLACLFGSATAIPWPGNPGPVGTPVASGVASVTAAQSGSSLAQVTVNPGFCGGAIGTVAPEAVILQQAYQAATATAGAQVNAAFIGAPGAFAGPFVNGLTLFAPGYKTPRSVQMNIGVQRELRPNLVFTADYIRNVSTRTLLGIDANHDGDVAYFSAANAATDRDSVQTAAGCSPGPGQAACVVANMGGAANALAAYSGAGIGSAANVTGGAACPFCAFPGKNPNLGENVMNFPVGRSVYNGLDVSLKQRAQRLGIPGVKTGNFQFSYSFSRFVSQVFDQDFVFQATDYRNANRFTGPNALDRTHQFSFGGTFDLPAYFRLGLIGHFFSPLPQNVVFAQVNGAAEVLVTDLTGDGTTGDPVPGTNYGSFMRDFSVGGLNNVISKYNANLAGQPTPAGNTLIKSGVFTLADLQAIGGVQQALAPIQPGAVGLSWLKTFDLNLGWAYRIKERVTVEPTVGIFNLFNFANFDLAGSLQGSNLQFLSSNPTQPGGTIGGTIAAPFDPNGHARTNRASLQSGTNALGAPRSLEWGMKITF
jgi:hypothetical protein